MQADSMSVVDSHESIVTRNVGATSALVEGDLGDGDTREVQLAMRDARMFSREMVAGYVKAARDEDHPSEARKNRDSLANIVFPKQSTVAIQINMGSLMSELADKMTRQ